MKSPRSMSHSCTSPVSKTKTGIAMPLALFKNPLAMMGGASGSRAICATSSGEHVSTFKGIGARDCNGRETDKTTGSNRAPQTRQAELREVAGALQKRQRMIKTPTWTRATVAMS